MRERSTQHINGDLVTLPDGRRISYMAVGPEREDPVLYFHGCPGSRLDALVPRAQRAAEESRTRVLALDRPGYGLSDPSPGRCVMDWAEDVRAFADAIGLERFAVYGLSAGGPHALACAARLGDRVTAAASISGTGPPDAPRYFNGMGPNERALQRLTRISPRLVGPVIRLAARNAKRNPAQFFRDFEKDCSPTDRALLADASTRDGLRDSFLEAVSSGTSGIVEDWAAIVRRPWGFEPRDIKAPTLLMFGDADMIVPVSHGRHLARCIPNARVVEVSGEGHLLILTRLNEILAFLTESRTSIGPTATTDRPT